MNARERWKPYNKRQVLAILISLMADDLTHMLHFANAAAYLVTTRKGAIRSMPGREQVEMLAASFQ